MVSLHHLLVFARTLNLVTQERDPKSINSSISNFMFLPPSSSTLRIQFHIYPLWLPGTCWLDLAVPMGHNSFLPLSGSALP